MSPITGSHIKPPRIAMLATVIAALAHVLYPVTLHVPLPWTGVLAGVTGFVLMLRAWWLFKQAGTAICPTKRSTALIRNDVYAYTRNPMYLGIAGMLAAPGLATGWASFYVAILAFVLIIDRVYCPYEERKATREFGDDYRRYAASVRRW